MTTGALPTAADEARFWQLIESAWTELGPEPAELRRRLLHRAPDAEGEDRYALDGWLPPFMKRLEAACAGMSSRELTGLDRVLERKMYDIDRSDIHAVTDGSDDGFLYARGYIVAVGQEFYEAVKADPRMAIPDADCEEICYFFGRLHDGRFGAFPETGSGISRGTCSNLAGWQ
ncbi:DUF4240 domain-containing protein [Actinoplanes aureus]|uniref:DUF4240 domain-containing protein n=1 Tax=Actinoplanes aureus TaxID=2792083 RepID=A0A931G2L3_9ACTN|nr:DUF4240 domain-containing protein [Actinoplanes aureus]MBG0563399.1 DUF4240 domain-containing protein [Actinoplanes aureus]